ncbi:hypothetical protein EV1_008068 [Malus domestica]
MPLSGVLKEEKPKGSKVWSPKPLPTTMVDGDKNGDRTGSCRHQLLPPDIRRVVRALEYKHLIAQEKPKGSKVWSLKPLPTTMVDGDKNGDRTGSCRHQLLPPESRTAEQLRVGVGVREQCKKLEPTRRQLDSEKKKQTKGPRVESLNKITILEQMM